MISARCIVFVTVVVFASACHTGRAQPIAEQDGNQRTEVPRDLLVEDLRSQVERASGERQQVGMRALQFVPDSVQFREEQSKAAPGVKYAWGTYEPPGSFDLLFTSVAGLSESGAKVLSTPQDWFELIARRRWAARSAEEAIKACSEVIAYAGPRRDIAIRPTVYEGPSTLEQGFAVDRDSLSRRLEPPRVHPTGNNGSRAVTLWALEGGQTTRYQCTFAAAGGGSLAVQDSIYGFGLLPRGP